MPREDAPGSYKFPEDLKPDFPPLHAAEAHAASLVEKAALNEAVRVISDLEVEVQGMHISNRFSATNQPNEDFMHGQMNPVLRGLSEAEHKRQTILLRLQQLKSSIIMSVGNLESIVLDMEATKIDD